MRLTSDTLLWCLLSLLKFCHAAIYTDTWATEIEGGEEVARAVAERNGFTYVDQIMPGFYQFQHRKVAKRSTYHSHYHHENLAKEPQVKWLEQQVVKKRVKRDLVYFTDPKWKQMWYLNRESGGNMNVEHAWKRGFTGKGVVVSILDDGIERDHPDLAKNYDSRASYDVNGNDDDPQPRYDYSNENRHGTRCAGEVAAEANNNVCSVGVAFDAKIGGVRMLDGDVTDSVEAKSLSLSPQHIQIYSASWGPDDDGRTVDGPAYLASRAFSSGVNTGRGGLGSIFVWASGNGGRDGDSCNCDGYTNSIYTLSISSATEYGNIPWYSEACSSTLATTYSSGAGGERQIVTTDLRKGCTETHTGTSASAPLAAGICALALQANPRLTWRDMQHVVVRTANPKGLQAGDWVTNAVGRKVSHSFGYGVLDASAMVNLALNWTTVPPQHACTIQAGHTNKVVPVSQKIQLPLKSDGCRGTNDHVLYLEHVQTIITLTAQQRGEVEIFLTSPMGTRSTLLAHRPRDMSKDGFTRWAFMTTHNWGEFANGTWLLEIANGDSAFRTAKLREWSLVLYGTSVHPSSAQPATTTIKPTESPTVTYASSHKNNPPPKSTVTKLHYNCSSTAAQHKISTSKPEPVVHSGPIATANPRHMPATTEAELKTWSLILHGTERDPQRSTCYPGYSILTKSCVQECPEGFARYADYIDLVNGTTYRNDICKLKTWHSVDLHIIKLYITAFALSLSCVVLFLVIFGLLQARDRNLLCFRQKLQNLSRDREHRIGDNASYSVLKDATDSEDEILSYLERKQGIYSNGIIPKSNGSGLIGTRENMVSIPLNDSGPEKIVFVPGAQSDNGSLNNHLLLSD
ncbi:furin-like protease kpc-1 isoform X2 [Lineus longissimus]|uniref:furin-like protease kpc-1 isoform X2 n=1 Tax=Lineus longissimus TaxID=88925 RepID=UPI00315DC61A